MKFYFWPFCQLVWPETARPLSLHLANSPSYGDGAFDHDLPFWEVGGGGGYGAEYFEHSSESYNTVHTTSGYYGHPAPTHICMLPSVCILKRCYDFF